MITTVTEIPPRRGANITPEEEPERKKILKRLQQLRSAIQQLTTENILGKGQQHALVLRLLSARERRIKDSTGEMCEKELGFITDMVLVFQSLVQLRLSGEQELNLFHDTIEQLMQYLQAQKNS